MNTDKPKYAVLDCESSGLFNFSLPADAEGQPRLAISASIILRALHVAGKLPAPSVHYAVNRPAPVA